MGKKVTSGAAKRKKKKEREKAAEEAIAEMERLKLGPTKLWNGLVLHHKDIFAAHVIPKLNRTDRFLFSEANRQNQDVLKYAGLDVSRLGLTVCECTSISTLEWAWNRFPWGEENSYGEVMDQAWFCSGVAATNKLEFLKWARELKHCEWNERPINTAADKGNLEMLKYCFSNGCPYDEMQACRLAAYGGHLHCLRFLFDKVKPSRETEKKAAQQAAGKGHLDMMKYFVEERKTDAAKYECVATATINGQLDCLKYLVEEAKVPLNHPAFIASARYIEHHELLNYLREKECPEPTDEEYDWFVKYEFVVADEE